MTIDEIAKKWCLYMPSSNTRNAMQEYADQQTSEKNSDIERLKAELNELKERHKGDIENAYVYAAIDWSDRVLIRSDVEPYAEQYYKQKFESND